MQELWNALRAEGPKDIILDTDTYNEVDDQYALAYAMRSPKDIRLLAVTVAPFSNDRAATPGEGMEKSFAEAHHIRGLVDPTSTVPIYRGSTTYLPSRDVPVKSEAADAIIRLAREATKPLFLVAVGAITNVASALLLAPDIKDKLFVIWLGGHSHQYKDNREFNLIQDVPAAQVVFDSGVPLLQIPCNGVCTEFVTTVPELEYYLGGKNELCDYLLSLTRAYNKNNLPAWSKVIWDVTALGVFTVPKVFDMVEIPRPVITDGAGYYATDLARPRYIYVRRIRRDALYHDLFEKLAEK